jgi:hypothetical protein
LQQGGKRTRKWEPACKPGSVADSHSSGMHVTVHLERPTREPVRAARRGQKPPVPLFGLAPGGVYPATGVAIGAVRSYRTISPLPTRQSGFRRCVFCGTFRRLAPPRRYLAPCPAEPGLSSPAATPRQRLPGRLPLTVYCMPFFGQYGVSLTKTSETPYRHWARRQFRISRGWLHTRLWPFSRQPHQLTA